MLKRQRPSSPPPSKPSVPLLDSDMMIARDSKRRRTLPPVLDGTSRGWGQPQCNDPELEELSDDELVESEQTGVQNSRIDSAEYKSANSVLRELHTLYQNRLIFSPTNPWINSPSRLNPSPPQPQPVSVPYDAHIPNSKFLPALSEHSKGPSYTGNTAGVGNGMIIENEVHLVTERYENTNRYLSSFQNLLVTMLKMNVPRYLGNLFLSRRRELGSNSQDQDS